MRKIVVITVILALLGACSTASSEKSTTPSATPSPSASYEFTTNPDKLAPDLQAYLNSLGSLGTLENEVVGLFDAVSGSNFTSDAQLQKQLELIIPKANDFLTQLQKVETKHPEIVHFHQQYVAIWQQQATAFTAMDRAITQQDQSALQAAGAEVESARSKIAALQAELKALCDYAGVQIVF